MIATTEILAITVHPVCFDVTRIRSNCLALSSVHAVQQVDVPET